MFNFKTNLLITSLFFLLLANGAQAARVYFNSENSIRTKSFFEADVIIDSQDEAINAVEGRIYFPDNLLEFVNIKESNSIINFWIDKPRAAGNSIEFSGIVPGGYTGQGDLFQIVFRTKSTGQGDLDFENVKVLLNDGFGTEASLSTDNMHFSISDDASAGEDVIIVDLTDQEKPEPFTPIISKISEIGGDNYLLIFYTQDKGSGINHYQVKEGYGPFVDAESPYLLKNQNLDKKIVVKAVDKSGNERIVTISPVYPRPWYKNYTIFVIILVVVVAFIFGRVSWTKTKKIKSK